MLQASKWAIIGAGPAGIAAVGKLIDQGIAPHEITWIDQEFKVGDFGTRWQKVPSNTRVSLFLKFFEECKAYHYLASTKDFTINKADPSGTCLLAIAAEPLQWISDNLKQQVNAIQSKVKHLKLKDRHWEITLTDNKALAKNVVLATGAKPKSMSFPGIEEISLYTALDHDKLALTCNKEDTVAVFGSSHSAIIILKTLLEQCQVKKVINFYQSPLRYAVYFNDWILFDNTGLKGCAAVWARENIDGKLPAKLTRVISNPENIQNILPACNKAIFAVGFQKRIIPVDGMQTLEYNSRNGIIAPGLFGLGIAFPEAKTDRYGTVEYSVGLWKFMQYLDQVLPVWLNYSP